ncbi:enoyl-CoA hydratase/isomerase family protein [Glaciecola sp. XM2]|uniref:enoyl-CoA hydratase/isomerase family protein n=1 Tax=Glaciecola sp. XM2 TaxID=1914931 RepID=UPI001BDE9104|nr:enoyl-CoA hydratase/isomerase family protein [Glaciecola sp. XM2]MBT1449726.1 enoyl-CoA hydratase/isomerase family protein [Glaciecola sp. XM2]
MHNVELEIDKQGVARVTLNRPDVHNAFDENTIAQLIEIFDSVDQNDDVRVMILQAKGKSFSAGADLNWMQKMATYAYEQNKQDAGELAKMLNKLYSLSKPTIARVQGAAFGGAVGLVACCDMAIGSRLSKFCLSEVKLGLIPATISPYVIQAIGLREAKRLFMTAEVISSRRARRLGLLNETVSEEDLDTTIDTIIKALLKNGPTAVSQAKALASYVSTRPIDTELIDYTTEQIAQIRVSQEGQEGLNAFLNKRKPNWIADND